MVFKKNKVSKSTKVMKRNKCRCSGLSYLTICPDNMPYIEYKPNAFEVFCPSNNTH